MMGRGNQAKHRARRRGGEEARRRGGEEARRRGGEEARRRGGEEARRRGGEEARRRGGEEARRRGGEEARRRGGEEARRRGGEEARSMVDLKSSNLTPRVKKKADATSNPATKHEQHDVLEQGPHTGMSRQGGSPTFGVSSCIQPLHSLGKSTAGVQRRERSCAPEQDQQENC